MNELNKDEVKERKQQMTDIPWIKPLTLFLFVFFIFQKIKLILILV